MPATELVRTNLVRVVDYRCTLGPRSAPAEAEVHRGYSLSYVRKGTFGVRARGDRFELVTGSFFIGRPGAEYVATHDHGCGDECLSFQLSEELVDSLGAHGIDAWDRVAVSPLAKLLVLAERAQHDPTFGGDELAMLLTARFLELVADRAARPVTPSPVDRKRAVRAADWIDARAPSQISLEDVAREAGLSAFHFLRVFSSVFGVTPHQYLVAARLRRAAARLAGGDEPVTSIAYAVGFADLSNFTRTFRAAAGVTPRAFRSALRHRSSRMSDQAATDGGSA